MFSESCAITGWLYPEIGFDTGRLGRDASGRWVMETIIDSSDLTTPPFEEALHLLELPHNLPHLIQLILHYPDHCRKDANKHKVLSMVQQVLEEKTLSVDSSTNPSLLFLLTRLVKDDDCRRRASRLRDLAPGHFDFIRKGPSIVVSHAERILHILSAHGLSALLFGSLALFLQRPFRLSPDIDISVAGSITPVQYANVLADLQAIGIEILEKYPNYIGGVMREQIPISVDIEIGTAYHYFPFDTQWLHRPDFTAGKGTIMSERDMILLKKKRARLKDLADLTFLEQL